MQPTESEFCREQAERLLRLAKECKDLQLRRHLTQMAEEWVGRAKVEGEKRPA
jgi:hypothetical protein